jgi:hypothetical protein
MKRRLLCFDKAFRFHLMTQALLKCHKVWTDVAATSNLDSSADSEVDVIKKYAKKITLSKSIQLLPSETIIM